MVGESYLYAMSKMRMPAWPVLVLSLMLMFWLGGAHALAAGTLIVGHFTHLLVVCMFDMPLIRYIYASEMLVYIATFLLVVGSTHKMFGIPDLNISSTWTFNINRYRRLNG